jgi:enterochelin esterase-like enzyme
MNRTGLAVCALFLAITTAVTSLTAHARPDELARTVSAVSIERIKVYGAALEGNIEGNDATREVWVVLPPSYGKEPGRRYPVVYALHGFTATPEKWFADDKLEQRIGNAFRSGTRDMILVFPNAYTVHGGSMYSTSVTTGDWESFITRDLVRYIDSHYRTIPQRESRGLMGHSMGGYGTIRLGMKYPEVFSSLYAMSACCLSARDLSADLGRQIAVVKTREQAQAAHFFLRATFATAAAWSPNPNKPPFFADFPSEDGGIPNPVLAQWAANAGLAMLPQYVYHLRQYQAIAFDVGNRDGLVADNNALHDALNRFAIPHMFQVYDGDHGSGVSSRFEQKVLPYFSKNLKF